MPLSLGSYALVGPLTERFLPNYTQGIEAAKVYCLSGMFLTYFGVSIIIPVVRKNAPLIAGYAVAILMLWGGGWVSVQKGYGIEGVAWARFVSSGFLCVFVLAYSYYLTTLTPEP